MPSYRPSSLLPAPTISTRSPKEWRPGPNWKFWRRWVAKCRKDICTAPRCPRKPSRRCCALTKARRPTGKPMSIHPDLKILMLEDVPEEAEVLERELRRAGLAFVAQRVQTKSDFVD